MSERLDQLDHQIDVAVITFSTPDLLAEYRSTHQLRIPILQDPERQTYRAYGLGRGSMSRVWGLRTMRRYASIVGRSGLGRLHRPTEDPLQLGGDFLVGPDGRLAWGFWSEGPDHRPGVEEIVRQIERVG